MADDPKKPVHDKNMLPNEPSVKGEHTSGTVEKIPYEPPTIKPLGDALKYTLFTSAFNGTA